ncbi:MAG: hypothetical protein JWN69_568, partial [Alphaproteobacteria bacterium]|nr:hypothetical protein [Alphaproteobacteria bacterium]
MARQMQQAGRNSSARVLTASLVGTAI